MERMASEGKQSSKEREALLKTVVELAKVAEKDFEDLEAKLKASECQLRDAQEAIEKLIVCHDAHRGVLERKQIMSPAAMCTLRGDAWRVLEKLRSSKGVI